MIERYVFATSVLALLSFAPCVADIGERASSELTRLQSSHTFANVPSDHGMLTAQHLERWKFEVTNAESRVFTVDARDIHAPVVRETFVRKTTFDPYSLQPGHAPGADDLRDVLSPDEYLDFTRAASVTTIAEGPLHLNAHFYRGRHAAYEVLEPMKRTHGVPDRFEWRSFSLPRLAAAIRAARSCDNGEDCAAWF